MNNLRRYLVLIVTLLACIHYTTLTPTQLSERGTRRYANTSSEKALKACADSLSTLGYKVTVVQPESGIIKTAPHSIMTSATGGAGYANVTDDGLAWAVAVEQSGNDVVVHATPRGFRNGSEVHEDGMWVAEVMDAKFKDLWNEIDQNLGTVGVGAPVRATK